MKNRKNMKDKVISLFSVLPFIQNRFSGIATIFMLHRVHPFEQNKLFPNENMKVSPEFLENFIIELKTKGYEFISLDRLYEILKNGEKVRKQVVFTLDDGYKDNYEIAYPIFKKYNVPFTIYITTSFLERTGTLWWYALEDILIQNDEVIFGGRKYICKSIDDKNKLFLKIRNIILGFKGEKFQHKLYEFFENYKIDWKRKCEELCMSWKQLQDMAKDPLVTIGGHTKNHYPLNKLSENEIMEEIVEGNKLIEQRIGKKVEHFAYPFGSKDEIGQREVNIIKKIDIKTATTGRYGNIYPEHKIYLECLPRIMLTENFKISYIGRPRKERVVTI